MDHSRAPRPPLDAVVLEAALARSGVVVPVVRVDAETGSTNADAAALAEAGAALPLLVATDLQISGRGRLDRAWVTPPGAAVLMSVALEPRFAAAGWGWLPLAAGVAVVTAVRAVVPTGVGDRLCLKWPNDVMVVADETGAQRKLAGILAERATDQRAVIGIGLNLSQEPEELPIEAATSLAIEGSLGVDRADLIAGIAGELIALVAGLARTGGDAEASGLADRYRALCSTLGRSVEVHLPHGPGPAGRAVAVTSSGQLVVASAEGEQAVSAGDVVHVLART